MSIEEVTQVMSSDGGGSCFGTDCLVEWINEKGLPSKKPIADVVPGDMLRVSCDKFAPALVCTHFGHDKDVEVPLVRVWFEIYEGGLVKNRKLETTPDHLLFLVPEGATPECPVLINAGNLEPGNVLYLGKIEEYGGLVIKVEDIFGCRRSVLTETGTIVV